MNIRLKKVLHGLMAASLLGAAACGDVEDAEMVGDGDRADTGDFNTADTRFSRIPVATDIPGPSFLSVADVTGDGQQDLLVSVFGKGGVKPGEVRLYEYDGSLERWKWSSIVGPEAGIKFPNAATASDIDGDGDLDVFVPAGFLPCSLPVIGGGHCGALRWYENKSGSWVSHSIVAPGSPLFYHSVEHIDFDGDGIKDMVTVGEEKRLFGGDRTQTQWFKGTNGPDRFESTPRVVGPGLGSFPRVRDIDGDGDLDIASAEYFARQNNGSFAWYERTANPSSAKPAGTFVRRIIDNTSGPSIMLSFVDNLYGDGITRAVGANHTNTAKFPADRWESAVFAFDKPADPRQPWRKTQLSSGIESRAGSSFAPQGAPGIFGSGDIDSDGDIDILVSGDGDPNVYWLEQQAPGSFETHVLAEEMGQAGAMQVVDLDGDGHSELLVSSYELDALYIYQFQGE